MDLDAAAAAVQGELERMLVGKQMPATATFPVGKITKVVLPDKRTEYPDSFYWEVYADPVPADTEGFWGQGLQTVPLLSEAVRREIFRRHFGNLAK